VEKRTQNGVETVDLTGLYLWRNESEWRTARRIADALGEVNYGGIADVIHELGEKKALELLQRTQEIEAAGGMPVLYGYRRRTPGGVFFYLARHEAGARSGRSVPEPAFDWAERERLFRELRGQEAVAEQMIVIFKGRPKRVLEIKGAVLAVFRQPALRAEAGIPRGLPAPPAEEVEVRVLMPRHLWGRVMRGLQEDERAKLAIQGQAAEDKELGGLVLWATKVDLIKPREKKPR